MDITLQYFDGCPNWKTADRHLATLVAEGLEATIEHELIDSYERAVEKGFRGSPTVLIDGVDPFADRDAPVGLACRVYRSEAGTTGSPTLQQLREAIIRARGVS
jgi:hypothetical protein